MRLGGRQVPAVPQHPCNTLGAEPIIGMLKLFEDCTSRDASKPQQSCNAKRSRTERYAGLTCTDASKPSTLCVMSPRTQLATPLEVLPWLTPGTTMTGLVQDA